MGRGVGDDGLIRKGWGINGTQKKGVDLELEFF